MTEKSSKDAKVTEPTDNTSTEAARKSNFAKAAEERGGGKKAPEPRKSGPRKNGRGKGWLWLLLFVVLAAAAGAWVWHNWPELRQQLAARLDFLPLARESERAPAAESEPQPTPDIPAPESAQAANGNERNSSADTSSVESQARITALGNRIEQQNRTIAQLQRQLAALQRDVTAQGNRIGELGNISRDDWQLAEADYLLRLANQRLLLERDSRAALGLVEEVDKILRQVDLPDLYGVRRQLARDITALKLVENIDREGLYLRLRALEEQLLRVNIQPQFDLATRDPAEVETAQAEEPASAWQKSWNNFTRFMGDSLRIRDGDIDPVLLSPQSETRFRQNLRLDMEQAELALLREDSTVYKDALNRARELLLQYGVASNQRDVLVRELEQIRGQPIEAELPNLAASQRALQNYIDRMHKTSAPGTETPDTGASGGDNQ